MKVLFVSLQIDNFTLVKFIEISVEWKEFIAEIINYLWIVYLFRSGYCNELCKI